MEEVPDDSYQYDLRSLPIDLSDTRSSYFTQVLTIIQVLNAFETYKNKTSKADQEAVKLRLQEERLRQFTTVYDINGDMVNITRAKKNKILHSTSLIEETIKTRKERQKRKKNGIKKWVKGLFVVKSSSQSQSRLSLGSNRRYSLR